MNILGKNLQSLREALNLIQSDVSDKINVSRVYISLIESGERTSVSQNVLKSLCKALSTTEEWLEKGIGWAYDPETTWKALEFIERQIKKFRPIEIIIFTYRDDLAGVANGFVFIRPNDVVISMAGAQTRAGYLGKGSDAYCDALIMIKSAKIKVGHIKIDNEGLEKLLHTDLSKVVKRAKYDKNIIEQQLYVARPDKYPDPYATRSIADTQITLSNDELAQLLGKMTESKTNIQDLIRYMNKKSK